MLCPSVSSQLPRQTSKKKKIYFAQRLMDKCRQQKGGEIRVGAWRQPQKEEDWELGQKMNVQEVVYGRRMRGFTWPFCQPLTPKVSSTMPLGPSSQSLRCSVKGKRLTGTVGSFQCAFCTVCAACATSLPPPTQVPPQRQTSGAPHI